MPGKKIFMNRRFVFVFLFFVANRGMGAFIPPLDSEIHQSPYIFEAHKISEKSFQPKPGGKVYKSVVYEISKVFKGNLKCGKIEMIIDEKYLNDIDFALSGGLPISDTGIVLADSSFFPSLMHFKDNPIPVVVREMIEYNHHGSNQYFEYFQSQFVNKQSIYDTLVRAIGHDYISCNEK